MFTTDRLQLCPFTEADLDDLMRLWNEPLIQRLITTDYTVPRGPKFKESLRTKVEKPTFSAIIRLKETREFMGQTTLAIPEPKNRDGTFGICLIPKFWNNGYGTEVTRFMVDYALRWFGLQRVSLHVFAHNERAIAVYQRIGFVIEGRKRQSIWVDNGWEDTVYMGILREEWTVGQR